MSCYRHTGLQFASTKDFDQIALTGEAILHEVREGNRLEFFAVDQFLEGIQIDAFVLDAVRVGETKLRYAALSGC